MSPKYRFVAEIQFTVDDDGGTQTVLVGTDPWRTAPTDTPANAEVLGVLIDPGSMTRELFSRGRVEGPVVPGFGDIICGNGAAELDGAGVLDAWLDYGISGSKVTVRRGVVGAAYPSGYHTCFVAYAVGHEVGNTEVRIRLRDRMEALDVPLITEAFAGTGGVEGTGGVAKPPSLVSGDVGYFPINLLSYVDQTYHVHSNGTQPSTTSSYKLFEGGIEVERGPDYASLSEFLTIPPAELTCRFYFGEPSVYSPEFFLNGPVYVRRGTPPVGDQRAFGYGTPNDTDFALNGGQYVATFTAAVLARRAGISNDDIDGADTSLQSFMCDDSALTVKDALARLCQATQSFCHFTRLDKFRSGRLIEPDDGDSVMTITDAMTTQGLRRMPVPGMPSPVWKVSVKAGKTWPCTVLEGASAEMKDRLTREVNSTVQGVADGTKLRDPGAIVETLDMENLYLANNFGRDIFLERYFALYGGRRDYYTFTLPLTEETIALELHDVVTLQSPRFLLSAGKKFRIISIAMDLGADAPTLTFGVWGGVPGVYTGPTTKIPTTGATPVYRSGIQKIAPFTQVSYAEVSSNVGNGNAQTIAPFTQLIATASDIPSSLLLHFDESSGSTSFADSSQYGRTLTGHANLYTSSVQSKFGGCSARLDKNTIGIIIPSSSDFASPSTGTPWSVDFWFYHVTTPNTTSSGWVFRWIASGTSCVITNYSNAAVMSFNMGLGQVVAPSAASSNAWHHCCVMFDPSRATAHNTVLTIDGVAVIDGQGSGWSGNVSLQILGDSTGTPGTPDTTNFYVDELRFVIGSLPFSPGGFTPPTGPYTL